MILRFAHGFAGPNTSFVTGVDRAPMLTGMAILLAYLTLVALGEGLPVAGAPEAGGLMVFMWFTFAGARSYAQLIRSYRTAKPPDDAQVKRTLLAVTIWLMAALVWLDFLGVLTLDRLVAIGLVTGTMLLGSAVLSFGIFAKGTIDPDLALRRSVVAGTLLGTGILTFGVLEAARSDWVVSHTALPPGASIWIAAGLLTEPLHPANEWLRPRVLRRFDSWELGRRSNDDG